jgi:diguanylate cyclase (GGDEF)-like protein/putative nucleotidyltransferase with HDIG domain/PAS domain S-box-containing protein
MDNKYKALINLLPDLIFIYGEDGTFLDCPGPEDRQLLLPKEMFIGKKIADVMPPDIATRAMEGIRKALETGEVQHFEYNLSSWYEGYFDTRMIKFTDNTVIAIVRDITEDKKRRLLIEELSFKDQLTKVYNRHYFDQRLEALDKAEFLPLAMVIFDVNGLKMTNDAFGHYAGDELLKSVAKGVQEATKEYKDGFVARIGGDEFVFVCPNVTNQEIDHLLEGYKNNLKDIMVNDLPISVSIGSKIRSSMAVSLQEIFMSAEDHMYRNKLAESRSRRYEIIQSILTTINEKNIREKLHSERVSLLSGLIGKIMGLSEDVIIRLETAGLLHDIGKVALPEDILTKPSRLTKEEYNIVQKHSESGYQLLRSVDAYLAYANIVLSHHERMDGKGYPRGLKGNEISLEARIIAVADAYEAMRGNRTYRASMSHEMAVEELRNNAGTQFDEQVVQAFVENFKASEWDQLG